LAGRGFCDERDRHPWVPIVSSGGRPRACAVPVSRFEPNGAPVTRPIRSETRAPRPRSVPALIKSLAASA